MTLVAFPKLNHVWYRFTFEHKFISIFPVFGTQSRREITENTHFIDKFGEYRPQGTVVTGKNNGGGARMPES